MTTKRKGGRKKGVPNKITASMREAWLEAFNELGGVPALVRWGKTDKRTFYTLATKLIPTDITSGGKALGLVELLEAAHVSTDPT